MPQRIWTSGVMLIAALVANRQRSRSGQRGVAFRLTAAKHWREIPFELLSREMSFAAHQVAGDMCAGRTRQVGTSSGSGPGAICLDRSMCGFLLVCVACKEYSSVIPVCTECMLQEGRGAMTPARWLCPRRHRIR